jgi:cell division protein YceG involved in septum cleavage
VAVNTGPDAPGGRTEQERERAREERERRRLAKVDVPRTAVEPPLPPPPLPDALASSKADRSSLTGYSRSSLTRGPIARAAVLVGILVVLAALVLAAVVLLKPTSHPVPPPPPPKVVKLVIPEGFTRAQIALRARADGVTGDYLAASVRSPELDPRHYGAPVGTPDLEGFLFPATYEIYAGEPASRLVARQLGAFEENFGVARVRGAKALGITSYQLLIVASMVEREAQVPSDRAKIAAVIYNRLHAGMPLGIDATIYYAVEQQQHIATYTGELTESQLHIDSPYNTRLHTGLPPTPISNPGLASIEAAAHPAHVPYLYYVAGADGCGEQVFSVTATQFESDVAAYRAAVARGGGKPPVCKRKR